MTTEQRSRVGDFLRARGKSDEWYTPPEVFEALGLRFDLDVCGPPGGVPWVPADETFSEDGLEREWAGRVWMNPPYSQVAPWTKRFTDHGHGVALVFARTETRWWHYLVPGATAVCFLERRLTFIPPDGRRPPANAPAGSALVAYGHDCARAVRGSGLGWCP